MKKDSYRYRDLTITPISDETELVVSCDISAGFGNRKFDIVKCEPEISASFTLRTAMLELISYGAEPLNVIDTLSVEYDPTGLAVIKQMKQDLFDMGYPDVAINGSTEDNLQIDLTTVSVTVIGQAPIRNRVTAENLTVFQLGTPLVGTEVLDNRNKIFSVKDVIDLRHDRRVVDMIPVGSKGIAYELGVLSKSDNSTLKLVATDDDEIKKTAGPSTVLLVAVQEDNAAAFEADHPALMQIAHIRQ